MRNWPAALAAAALAAAGGCARTLPPDRSGAALYRDLERIVSLNASTGWLIDRTEYEKMLPTAMQSVCRVAPEARERLLAWLDERIAALGGPVEEAYRKRGRDLSRVDGLLLVTRVRGLLARAHAAAPDDCPFWLQPEQPFRGRQITDDRWIVSAGGGGKVILLSRDDEADISGGGAGRLVLGRQLGPRVAVLTGVELGASAEFPRAEDGRGSLVFALDVVAPLVVRWHLVNTYFELEAGYLFRVTEENDESVSGVHAGVAFGGRATRQRWILPGAVFGISYERTFPDDDGDGERPLDMIKLGFRAAIDLPF